MCAVCTFCMILTPALHYPILALPSHWWLCLLLMLLRSRTIPHAAVGMEGAPPMLHAGIPCLIMSPAMPLLSGLSYFLLRPQLLTRG
jgi:hypothetical protein